MHVKYPFHSVKLNAKKDLKLYTYKYSILVSLEKYNDIAPLKPLDERFL